MDFTAQREKTGSNDKEQARSIERDGGEREGTRKREKETESACVEYTKIERVSNLHCSPSSFFFVSFSLSIWMVCILTNVDA